MKNFSGISLCFCQISVFLFISKYCNLMTEQTGEYFEPEYWETASLSVALIEKKITKWYKIFQNWLNMLVSR